MRKFFLFLAVLCSSVLLAQTSGVLCIPTVENATITIYRNGISLANGAPVSTGDNLQINYAPDNGYYIDGRVSYNVVLTDEMFTNIGEYLTVEPGAYFTADYFGHSGWTYNTNAHGYTGTRSINLHLEATGETKLAFAWSLEQGSMDYGQFKMICEVNGTNELTYDFTVSPNPVGNILQDTVTFTGNGSNSIQWQFIKETDGTVEDDGRTIFVGEIGLVTDQLHFHVPVPVVKEMKPLVPRVRISESGSALIRWSSYDGMYASYRLVVSAEELQGNPEYWKGMQYVADTFYTATNLIDGQTYHLYLQGARYGKMFDWVHTTFVAGEINACQLTIEMHSSNSNWGGELGFYINEGTQSTLFSMKNSSSSVSGGMVETATYVPHGPIQIVGHNDWGGCYGSNWFVIYDEDGNEFLRIDKEDFCDLITNNAVMYEGRVCPLECQATVSDLESIVNGTSFTIRWNADGADRFEVAVLRQSHPTDEEIEAAEVVVDETHYTFTGVEHAGYKVYVRPVCADGHKGEWESILAYGELEGNQENFAAIAQPITLDYIHEGDILADGFIGTTLGQFFPVVMYSFDLADSTDVGILFRSTDITRVSYSIFQELPNETEWKTIKGDVGESDGWSDILWNDTLRLTGKIYLGVISLDQTMGDYMMNIYGIHGLTPKAIDLGFSETADFTDGELFDVMYFGIVPAKAYSFTPQETVNVNLHITLPDNDGYGYPSVGYLVYRNAIADDSLKYASPVYNSSYMMTCQKDTTYYIVICPMSMGAAPNVKERYSISLTESQNKGSVITSTPKVIPSLDYVDTWDFADAEEFMKWGDYRVLVRVYEFTPQDTVDALLWLESPDYNSDNGSLSYYLYQTAIDEYYYLDYQSCGSSMTYTLFADTTYYIVLYNYLDYGGEASHHYTFKMYDRNHLQPVPTTLITPDAYIEDTVGDFIPALGEKATIYEYVVTGNKRIAFSLEALNQKEYNMYLYAAICKDELSVSGYFNAAYADNPHYTTAELEGSPSGTHYYFVVSDYEATPYRFILREEPDYNHVPVKGELEIGQAYRSALSVKDGFVFHPSGCDLFWNGPFEAYEAMLRGGEEYRVMMHKLSVVSENTTVDNVGIMGTVFRGDQLGSYNDNNESNECMQDEDWIVLEPSAMNDKKTFMFEATLESKNYEDSVVYEFSVEEVKSFEDFMSDVTHREIEILPFEESDAFSSNVKVYDEDSHGFHNDPQSYIEQYGAYDALARRVKIGAGETVFAEFGGNADAVIQFYDPNTLTLLGTFDETRYAYPYEKGYFTNEGTEEMEVVAVCSFNQVLIADAEWRLRMSTSEMDLDDAEATPKADQESITLYKSDGIAEAIDALSQINLTAMDKNENFICTIPNNRFGWDVDLTNNLARYEVNNQDLPMGYVFEEPIMFINVIIERIPDLPTGFIDGIANDPSSVLKILCADQVYIIRDGIIYNIMGQRVK